MNYQQAKQEAVSVRMPAQATGRQLKPITDNRPEAAAQLRLLEGMARENGVAQRICTVAPLKQNDCNCGLFSLKMAINALPKTPRPTDKNYDDAAEAVGSNVGEIFTADAMENIVTCLKYTPQKHTFTNSNDLEKKLNDTLTNPVLIAFSNGEYVSKLASRKNLAGASIPISTTVTGITIPTQRGHWSVVESLNVDVLTLCNPQGYKDEISSANMKTVNAAMKPTPPLDFEWNDFVPGAYAGMDGRVYVLEEDSPTTMKRKIVMDGKSKPTVGTTFDFETQFNKIKQVMKTNPRNTTNIQTEIQSYLAAAATANKIYKEATYDKPSNTLRPGTQDNSAANTAIPKKSGLNLRGYIIEIK